MKSLMLKAAREAGKATLRYYGNVGKLKYKEPRSIVTKADILSEKIIMEAVRKKFPGHNFLTEESGDIKKGSEYTWIIDPIDGTTNFASSIPYFAVSIALAKNDEVIMGAVYNPCANEMFFAEKGKGSYLSNKKLNVSKKNELKNALAVFDTPNKALISRKTFRIMAKNYGEFRGIRNFGAAALNLCYIASAKFDLYFSLSLKPWDAAAAKLIVEEAGGRITNINNEKWKINDNTLVASNKILHDKFIKLLKNS